MLMNKPGVGGTLRLYCKTVAIRAVKYMPTVVTGRLRRGLCPPTSPTLLPRRAASLVLLQSHLALQSLPAVQQSHQVPDPLTRRR